VIAYRATHSTSPGELAQFAAGLLRAGRRRRGAPEGSRALTCFWQAVAGLRWFRDRTTPDALARDHGISRATACRYLDEVVAVLAAQAPDLRAALERAEDEGRAYVLPARQQGTTTQQPVTLPGSRDVIDLAVHIKLMFPREVRRPMVFVSGLWSEP
jgi:hypothetical protein